MFRSAPAKFGRKSLSAQAQETNASNIKHEYVQALGKSFGTLELFFADTRLADWPIRFAA